MYDCEFYADHYHDASLLDPIPANRIETFQTTFVAGSYKAFTAVGATVDSSSLPLKIV